jgi:hypothetical protein
MLARSGFASACQHGGYGGVLRINISSSEDQRGQEQECECDKGYAAKVCPVYAILDG